MLHDWMVHLHWLLSQVKPFWHWLESEQHVGQVHVLPDFIYGAVQVKSHAPLALQVLVPFAGGVHAVQLADVKQPLSGVLPTQLPLHKCCGWVHELPLEEEPLGPEPPVEGLPPISVVLIDVLPPFEFVVGPEPPFEV